MKYIIIILMLILLSGCSKKAEVTCDYKTFIDQNNNLMTQNTALQNEKSACLVSLSNSKNDNNISLSNLRNDNNQLKLQLLNSCNNVTCKVTGCSYYADKLNICESSLEDCWLNSNQTYYGNNQTLINSYNNCTAKLRLINITLN